MSAYREQVFRWIFSPYTDYPEGAKPLAAEFCQEWTMPHPRNGKAMVYCRMTRGQLVKAQQHPELVVVPSLHLGHQPVHADIAAHHALDGAKAEMSVHEFLAHMAQFHPYFEPVH